jgi:hypothetical protein
MIITVWQKEIILDRRNRKNINRKKGNYLPAKCAHSEQQKGIIPGK